LGFSGKILTYQMRTLSDERRSMAMGGALTERKIKIWKMEAETDGCSRPPRGLHLQSSLPAGGSAIAVGRGVAWVGRGGRSLYTARIRGKQRGCLRGQISRDQNRVGQIICLSRQDLADHVQGERRGPGLTLVSCTPPFLLPPPGSDCGVRLPSESDNLPRLFHESVLRQRGNPHGGGMIPRRCPQFYGHPRANNPAAPNMG